MSVYKRGGMWWYHFTYAGRNIEESAKTGSKTLARDAERKRRRELEEGFNGLGDPRKERVRTVAAMADEYLKDYKAKHEACNFVEYAVKPVVRLLGEKMLIQIDERAVQEYQRTRLSERASPVTINGEVGLLTRVMKKEGAMLRAVLRRENRMLRVTQKPPGKAFSIEEKDRLMAAAGESRSPLLLPALTLALNAGMRDGEIRRTRWSQIDFVKGILTVGKAKSSAGQGRTIPLNSEIREALIQHAKWYVGKFGELKPEWYVFPSGHRGHMDPTRPISSLRGPWTAIRTKTGIRGRWHDTRHTLITELAESGASNETIKAIAGHVSTRMLERYSHIRTEAKRSALEEVLKRRQEARDLKAAEKQAEPQQDATCRVN